MVPLHPSETVTDRKTPPPLESRFEIPALPNLQAAFSPGDKDLA